MAGPSTDLPKRGLACSATQIFFANISAYIKAVKNKYPHLLLQCGENITRMLMVMKPDINRAPPLFAILLASGPAEASCPIQSRGGGGDVSPFCKSLGVRPKAPDPSPSSAPDTVLPPKSRQTQMQKCVPFPCFFSNPPPRAPVWQLRPLRSGEEEGVCSSDGRMPHISNPGPTKPRRIGPFPAVRQGSCFLPVRPRRLSQTPSHPCLRLGLSFGSNSGLSPEQA